MALEEITTQRLIEILHREEQISKDNYDYRKKRLEDFKQQSNPSIPLIFEHILMEDSEEFTLLPTAYGYFISYEEGRFYYRGENQIYKKSIPSLNRQFNDDSVHNEVIRMIAELRLLMFKNLIFQLDIVKQWNTVCPVNYKALGQHYGLSTCLLDFTTDMKIALFFATCTFDKSLGCYRPLNNHDFNKNPGVSDYGVIYVANCWIPENPQTSNFKKSIDLIDDKDSNRVILPIGKQPFYRNDYQTAYTYTIRDKEGLLDNKRFTGYKFKHSDGFSKYCFELLHNGKDIYPNEGIDELSNEIESIKTCTIFNKKDIEFVYEHYCDKLIIQDIEMLLTYLNNSNFKIVDYDTNIVIDSEKLKVINEKYLANYDFENTIKKVKTRLMIAF